MGNKIINSILASLSSISGRVIDGMQVLLTISPVHERQTCEEFTVEHDEQPIPRMLPHVKQVLFTSI